MTAAYAAEALALQRQFERTRDWNANADTAPEWDDAAFATQNWMRLTPDELRRSPTEVVELFGALVEPRGARRRRRPRAGVRLRPRVPGPAMTPTHPTGRSPLARNRNFGLLWFGEGV